MRYNYPDGIDCMWLAADRLGSVATFITSGEGPIPQKILELLDLVTAPIEEELMALPLISEPMLLVDVPRPDSFLEIASRGIFVYDWGEFSHSPIGMKHSYRLVARPTPPLSIDDFRPLLIKWASEIQFIYKIFGLDEVIDPAAEMDCESGSGL